MAYLRDGQHGLELRGEVLDLEEDGLGRLKALRGGEAAGGFGVKALGRLDIRPLVAYFAEFHRAAPPRSFFAKRRTAPAP